MSGTHRRNVQAVFAGLHRSQCGQEVARANRVAAVAKVAARMLAKCIQEVEKAIGTYGKHMDGELRDEVMFLIHELLTANEELAAENEALKQELEQVTARLEQIDEIRRKLIEAYDDLVAAQGEEAEKLREQIGALKKQLEEAERKPEKPPKPKPRKTLDEQTPEELAKKLERLAKAMEKVQKQMDEYKAAEEEGDEFASKDATGKGFIPEPIDNSGCMDNADTLEGSPPEPEMREPEPHGQRPESKPGTLPVMEQERKEEGDGIAPKDADDKGNTERIGNGGHMSDTVPEEGSLQDTEADETMGSGQISGSDPDTPPVTEREMEEENGGLSGEEVKEETEEIDPLDYVPGTSDDPEYLNQVIEDLKKRLQEEEEEQEERDYRIHRTTHESNAPSRARDYSESLPSRNDDLDADDSSGDDEAAEEENEAPSAVDLEKEAEEAARRDRNKSPNRKLTGTRGKPKGSGGGGRKMPDYDEERTVHCIPSQCESCPHRQTCEALHNARSSSTRFGFDVEIRRILTRYVQVSCQCPNSGGEKLTGCFPEGINSWFQYGKDIQALAITLSTVGMVSYKRISDILRGILDDEQLSPTVIYNWVKAVARNVREVGNYIKAGVYAGDYLHSDETGVRVKGVLHWVHVACNMLYTYMRVDRQRGDSAMARIGILSTYTGSLMTDCWASYWDKGTRHGLCNAHLLRELLALIKFFARDKEWAQKMFDLLNEMNDERNKLKDENKTAFDPEVLESFKKRYDEIVNEGLKIHPDSEAKKRKNGKVKQCRGKNLLDRLKTRKDNFLLFLTDFNVPFTNNAAERALRLVAVKRAVVGSFGSYEGADDFALVWSFISTAMNRKLNPYAAIRAALDNDAVDFLFDKEELEELDLVAQNLKQINLERHQKEREEDAKVVKELEDAAKAREEKVKAKETAKAKAEVTAAEQRVQDAEQSDNTAELNRARKQVESARKRVEKALKQVENARKQVEKQAELAEKARKKYKQAKAEAAWAAKASARFLDLDLTDEDCEPTESDTPPGAGPPPDPVESNAC